MGVGNVTSPVVVVAAVAVVVAEAAFLIVHYIYSLAPPSHTVT